MECDWEVTEVESASNVGRCFAPANIALAKYWGKRDPELNLPANSSLSVTLSELGAYTTVEFSRTLSEDVFFLNGNLETGTGARKKVSRILDELRGLSGTKFRARVQSRNNIPTGAGLASSSSGLAAVAVAGAEALGLDLSGGELSVLARKGSGSAARSLFGGFVQWDRGEEASGEDCRARPVAPAAHWPLNIIIAVCGSSFKKDPSTEAMERTRLTSPFFKSWMDQAEEQVALIRSAVLAKNFAALAALSESNCLRMHAAALAASPGLIYWEPSTLAVIKIVRSLRDKGHDVFFTIDAGPNVVIFSAAKGGEMPSETEIALEKELAAVPGLALLRTAVGEGPRKISWET